MPRKQKKYHYIYKTTCLITNKFYIGMHSTDNLDDGYFGSGKRLWYSLNKYGKENHKCEILEFLPDRKSLKEKEAKIVNEEMLQDSMCMNLVVGGGGSIHGFKYINDGSFEHIKRCKNARKTCDKILRERYGKNFRSELGKIAVANRTKESLINGGFKSAQTILRRYGKYTFEGRKHTDETKRKISEKNRIHQTGEKNSQYGTCWIFSDIERKSIKINKKEIEKYLICGWKRGRKIKFDI